MKETVTSWDNASVTSGNVVIEAQFSDNNFGQLIHDYQAHFGTVKRDQCEERSKGASLLFESVVGYCWDESLRRL
ncbi:MAG: hypothetical protein Fues2KO_04230 [Fuerstiella sp.]